MMTGLEEERNPETDNTRSQRGVYNSPFRNDTYWRLRVALCLSLRKYYNMWRGEHEES